MSWPELALLGGSLVALLLLLAVAYRAGVHNGRMDAYARLGQEFRKGLR